LNSFGNKIRYVSQFHFEFSLVTGSSCAVRYVASTADWRQSSRLGYNGEGTIYTSNALKPLVSGER